MKEFPSTTTTPAAGLDSDALHKGDAAEISALTEKTTPADTDVTVIEDSAAATPFSKAFLSWSSLKAALKTYFDTIYPAPKFIVQGVSNAALPNAQFLGALATGLVKNTVTTGVLSIAAAGTDYTTPLTNVPPTSPGFSGILQSYQAGENLVVGNLCYQAANGKMYKANAAALLTMDAIMVATGTINANATGVFCLGGWYRNDGITWVVTGVGFGRSIFVDNGTAGLITQTAPTTVGHYKQKVGRVETANIVFLDFSHPLVEIGA